MVTYFRELMLDQSSDRLLGDNNFTSHFFTTLSRFLSYTP
jgi:hypothetical protein